MSLNKPSQYIIGIIIFSLIIMSVTTIISTFQADNSSYIDADTFTEFNDTFNKMDETQAQAQAYQDSIENANTDYGAFGVLNSLINTAWQVIRNIFNSFSFMSDVFTGAGKMFGLPSWIAASIISLITIILVFSILGAVFQRDL